VGTEEQTYHVIYNVEPRPEGIKKSDIPKTHGAADAVLICSMLYPEDGSFSLVLYGGDGRTGKDLHPNEIFKVWTLMAKNLSEDEDLSPARRELCLQAWEIWRDAVMGQRTKEEEQAGEIQGKDGGDDAKAHGS
jgi:hypothetical protein